MKEEDIKTRRIRWKCRRGMLELDLLFRSFFKYHYKNLTLEQQDVFERLLDQEDRDLQFWIFNNISAPDPELNLMIKTILKKQSI